jgi:hypothetical protein
MIRFAVVLREAKCGQAYATCQGAMAGPMRAWREMETTARQAIWMEDWLD